MGIAPILNEAYARTEALIVVILGDPLRRTGIRGRSVPTSATLRSDLCRPALAFNILTPSFSACAVRALAFTLEAQPRAGSPPSAARAGWRLTGCEVTRAKPDCRQGQSTPSGRGLNRSTRFKRDEQLRPRQVVLSSALPSGRFGRPSSVYGRLFREASSFSSVIAEIGSAA